MTPRRRLATTVGLLIGTFLASLDVTVVATAMPRIAADLSGVELYGGVFAGYLLSSTTTIPIYGKVADRWGRRPTYMVGMGLLLTGSALCALAPSMPLLIAARVVQGLGGGAVLPMTVTIFGDLYEVAQRARLQAVFSLVWGVSSVAGPAVGAVLVELFGWPSIFWVNLPIGGVAVVTVALSLREEVPHEPSPIDWRGAGLLAGCVLALLAGMFLLRGGDLRLAGGLVAASVVLGLLLVRVERSAPDPIVPLSLFTDRVIAIGVTTGVFLGGLLFTVIAYVPLLVSGVRGGSTLAAGSAIIPLAFAWTAGSFLAGRTIPRFGYRPNIRAGTAFAAVGTAGIAASTAPGLEWVLFAGAAFTGIGMGLTITSFNVSTQDRVPWQRRGAATALLLFSRNVGGTVVVSALGLVMAMLLERGLAGVPNAPAPEQVVDPERWDALAPAALEAARAALRDALQVVFAVAAASAALAFVVAWPFPSVRVGERPDEVGVEPAPSGE